MPFPWQATVQDQNGDKAPLAEITVRNGTAGGTLATIFSDEAGTPLSNPFDSDANGLAQFWADTGTYHISGSLDAQTTDDWFVTLGGGSAVLTVTAGETLTALKAITSSGFLCDIADVDSFAGISQSGAAIGEGVNLVRSGLIVDGSLALTADQAVFVADGGVLTQTDPGNSRRIGWAESTTSFTVDIFPTGTVAGGTSGEAGKLVFLNAAGTLDPTLLDLSTFTADPGAGDPTDNADLFPALDANGLLPSEYVPIVDISENTGGAGSEDAIVRADAAGLIDLTFIPALVNDDAVFTASGAITALDTVALTGANVVQTVALTPTSFAFDENLTTSEFDQVSQGAQAYSVAENVVLLFYSDNANSRYPTLVLATLDNLALTYGTPAVIESAGASGVSIDIDQSTGDIVCSWLTDSGTNHKATVVTISGTTVSTIGTPVTVQATGRIGVKVTAAQDGSGFMFTAVDLGTDIKARACTVSGLVLTLGTEITLATSDIEGGSAMWAESIDKYVVCYGDNTANQFYTRIVTQTGTSLSATTQQAAFSVTTPSNFVYGLAERVADSTIFLMVPRTGTVTSVSAGTLSASSISWTDTDNATATTFSYGLVTYSPSEDNFYVMGWPTSAAPKVYTFSVAGGIITEDSANDITGVPNRTINTQGTEVAVWHPVENRIVGMMKQGNPDNYIIVVNPGASETTALDFVGFAKDAALDAADVEIAKLGDFIEGLSGLTFNSDYFIAGDGTLSLVDQGFGVVGRAMSATKLLITKGT